MSKIQVSVYAGTDIGMHRSGNEDAFLVADLTTGAVGLGPEMSSHPMGERGSLLIVSDGMGGAAAGEVASELAVTTIRESLMESPPDMETAVRLRIATENANERIWNEAQANPELSGMGATVTATIVQSGLAYIAQVGDSRAYLIRGPQIKQLTKDQSFVQMLIDAGAIQPEQAASVPQNVIMQALGTQPNVKVALTTIRLCRNDCLLLCSDGLSNKLGPDEMKQAVEQAGDLKAASRALINIANERGGEDNITVVLARFDGDGLQAASDAQTITGSLAGTHEDYFTATGSNYSAPPPNPDRTAVLRVPVVDEAQAADYTQPQPAPQSAAAPAIGDAVSPYVSPEFVQAGHVQYQKKSYTAIIIMAIGALLLIAATVYFVYRYYARSVAPPAAPPPAESQPESQPSSDQPSSPQPQS
ncbi:MAG TPA: Stp1/IreP family PP2C-type Ser/Thr phosphatase [Blastocatellia bacterium]|nr:Stp1/IreP family PP2C-type Ser/Thr phosphatase [Blastocatellia bacterium]